MLVTVPTGAGLNTWTPVTPSPYPAVPHLRREWLAQVLLGDQVDLLGSGL